jgi:hypothetical protein
MRKDAKNAAGTIVAFGRRYCVCQETPGTGGVPRLLMSLSSSVSWLLLPAGFDDEPSGSVPAATSILHVLVCLALGVEK